MSNETKCKEAAKITLPWGGQLLNYCPAHANQICYLAQAMGNTIQVQKLTTIMECESNSVLDEDEKLLNKILAI